MIDSDLRCVMTGAHAHVHGRDDEPEIEHETCKQCKTKQKLKIMQRGPERHGSFHDSLVGILRPKPKAEKPELRHRQECRGKPRHEPPNLEFRVDDAHNFIDERPGAEPKTQAHGNGDGSVKKSQFKSNAVYCEVKLMELLGKAGPQARPVTPGKYEDAPDAYRVGVCCLLLGEMSDMDTPYSRVLRTILQNLEQAIYSNYVAPIAGGTFEQVPYFEMVARLEAKHQMMLEEQERWAVMVSENQVTTDGIQQQIEVLNDLLVREKAKVPVLQKDLLIAQKSLRKATKQVTELDQKLNQSRALVLDASTVKAQFEEGASKYENLHARYIEITKEVQRLQQNLAVARREAADGVPKELFNKLQNKYFDLQSKLQGAQKYKRQAATFTPRPDWLRLRGGPFIGYPSRKQAAEICAENKELAQRNLDLEAECAAAVVALAEALQPRIVEKKKENDKGKKGKKKK